MILRFAQNDRLVYGFLGRGSWLAASPPTPSKMNKILTVISNEVRNLF